jgi:hypothetical protein
VTNGYCNFDEANRMLKDNEEYIVDCLLRSISPETILYMLRKKFDGLYVGESLRDKMTPKSKTDINSFIQKYLWRIDNPLSEYVGKKHSIYADIIDTLGESGSDLDMIDRHNLKNEDFYVLHKFFLTLTQGSTPIIFNVKSAKADIIVAECFPEYKLACITTYSKYSSESQWVISKKYFENKVNESIKG